MRIEISAGGIIFRKKNDTLEILLLKDSKGKWTFPKGLVEKDEDRVDTAQREIAEEVGLKNTHFVAVADKVEYFYRWEGELVKKTVYYFIFSFTGEETPVPQTEEGIQEVQWFDPDEAVSLLGYKKSNKKILEDAIERITTL